MGEMARPTRVATLSLQVADELQSRIVGGQWPVGTKIPTEYELMDALGVSRSTIREAVRSLVHARLLEARAGDGTYVRSSSALEHPLVDRIARAQSREVMEVRAMLEQRLVRLAAARATPEGVERLRAAADEAVTILGAADSFEQAASAMTAFHVALGELAENPLLSELHRNLETVPVNRPRVAEWDDSVVARVRAQIVEVIDAIGSGEPDHAEQVVRRLQQSALPLLDQHDQPEI